MGSNYVRIQSYAPVSHDAHQHVDDLDTDVALSNVVCSLQSERIVLSEKILFVRCLAQRGPQFFRVYWKMEYVCVFFSER